MRKDKTNSKKVIKSKLLMSYIKDYLIKKYGDISSEWTLTLQLLEDNVELYQKCQDKVREVGIFDSTTGKKNPLLATMKDLQATIMKQIQHLGLSPYAASKIKNDSEDDTDNFLEDLVSE